MVHSLATGLFGLATFSYVANALPGPPKALLADASSTASSTVAASSATPPVGDCQEVAPDDALVPYYAASGVEYSVMCNHDIAGGDLSVVAAPNFQACFPLCDKNPQCVGFSWLAINGPGKCHLKSNLRSTPVEKSYADVAYILSHGNSAKVASSSAAKPTKMALANTNCAAIGDGATYDGYEVECKTAHPGGDLVSTGASSFQNCFPLCDAMSGCVGFAYDGGSSPGVCHFKSAITPGFGNSVVDFAHKPYAQASAIRAAASAKQQAATTTTSKVTTITGTMSWTDTVTLAPAPTKGAFESGATIVGKTGKTVTAFDNADAGEVILDRDGWGIDIPYGSATMVGPITFSALPSGDGIVINTSTHFFSAFAAPTKTASAGVVTVTTIMGAKPTS